MESNESMASTNKQKLSISFFIFFFTNTTDTACSTMHEGYLMNPVSGACYLKTRVRRVPCNRASSSSTSKLKLRPAAPLSWASETQPLQADSLLVALS